MSVLRRRRVNRVFRDRQGTINERRDDCVKRPVELTLFPGVAKAIRRLTDAGVSVAIVTNRGGIARDHMGDSDSDHPMVHDSPTDRAPSRSARRFVAQRYGSPIGAGSWCGRAGVVGDRLPSRTDTPLGESQPAAGRRYTVIGSSMHFTSGISFHTLRLANALSRRHSVSVVLMRQLVPKRFYPGRARVGAKVTNLRYDPSVDVYDGVDWYWIPGIFKALRALHAHRADGVVFQWWTGAVAHSYLVLAGLARLSGARIIFEVHEVQDPGEARLPLTSLYVRMMWRLMNPIIDAFVVHSRVDRDVVRDRYQTRAHRVEVIPVGSYDHYGDFRAIDPLRDAPSDACNLLFFGTIRPYKGLEDLIRAFHVLSADERSDFWLTVVGETWEGWTEPGALIEESQYRERMTFVNRYVTDAELAGYVAGADVIVLPYHRSSASGPLQVAMSAGRRVVVTAVGGLSEAAAGYAGAVFAPPRNPVALASAIIQARSLGSERFADPHSWETAVELYDGLIDRLERGDRVVRATGLGRGQVGRNRLSSVRRG